MADVNKFSEGLVDVAERFADVVDSAQGRGPRKSTGARWLILPVAGAAAYALATSSSGMARRTRKLMQRAKDRASDLPDADLVNRVKDVTGSSTTARRTPNTTTRSQTQSRRKRTGQTQRRRKTTAAR
jgi:hypothetical protein